MDLDVGIHHVLLVSLIITGIALIAPTPFHITLASLTLFFFGTQVFDKLTFVLNEHNSFFPKIPACYVCGAVAGTWFITGYFFGLLPKTLILFMAGMSALAIGEGLENYGIRPLAPVMLTWAIEMLLLVDPSKNLFGSSFQTATWIWLMGLMALFIAGNLKQRMIEAGTYKGYEENFLIFSQIILVSIIVTVL